MTTLFTDSRVVNEIQNLIDERRTQTARVMNDMPPDLQKVYATQVDFVRGWHDNILEGQRKLLVLEAATRKYASLKLRLDGLPASEPNLTQIEVAELRREMSQAWNELAEALVP